MAADFPAWNVPRTAVPDSETKTMTEAASAQPAFARTALRAFRAEQTYYRWRKEYGGMKLD